MPLLLLVLGLAALIYGLASDNSGLAIMGVVCVAGAVLSVLSTRLAAAPGEQDGEDGVKD